MTPEDTSCMRTCRGVCVFGLCVCVCVCERERERVLVYQRTRICMRAFTNARVYMLHVCSYVHVACMHACTCYKPTLAESNALLPAITSRGLMHLTNDGPCNAINVRGLGFCFGRGTNVRGLGFCFGRRRHTCPSVAISFSSCALNCTVSDVLLACEEY